MTRLLQTHRLIIQCQITEASTQMHKVQFHNYLPNFKSMVYILFNMYYTNHSLKKSNPLT